MKRIWRTLVLCLLVSSLVILPAIGMAADFELFWDPNCNTDADLEGYYIYYKEDASVIADPNGAIDIYVALTDIDFDPDNPSYLIADLLDDVRYCFAVTAWYGDEESDMSNEVCGINGAYDPDPEPNTDPVADAGGPYEATDTDDSGSEAVALDGSDSWDSDGTITSYQWFENGTLIGTGVNPTLSFSVGTHTVTLTVTDTDNATHANDTTVIVNPAAGELPEPDPDPDPDPGPGMNPVPEPGPDTDPTPDPSPGQDPHTGDSSSDGSSSGGCFIGALR